ncbi:hypothetical protein HJC23_002590 [Cyclotella cryptica]|uniref:AAA+ ATPase domain-containing protein n=1 Tax=Cyclotella cryptica TaxID=29204 RepID=A0ABD3P301_9STRA|eukprot:CCRYP_017697-RA/>CCRYP_017697-RA protein AED:0.07 eAED:0.01 QI:0/0.33/0/1/1/1/4/0/895
MTSLQIATQHSHAMPSSSDVAALIDGSVREHLIVSEYRSNFSSYAWIDTDDTFPSGSLTNSIRMALIEKQQSYPWETSSDPALNTLTDREIVESMSLFAEEVHSEVKELELNLTVVLDWFDGAYASLSHSEMSFGDEDPSFYSQSDDTYSPAYNYSSFDYAPWLQDIEEEVSIIDSWQVEAEKLTGIAIVAFKNLKEKTIDIMESSKLAALAGLMSNASTIYDSIQTKHDDAKFRSSNYSDDSPLLRMETWKYFEVENQISSDIALAKILSLPLKTYKLKDDKQQDFAVSRTERRTRYHLGPIVSVDDAIDHSAIFSLNIGAVAQLSKSIEDLSSKLLSTSDFLYHHSAFEHKISRLKATTGESDLFKTPSQLASEVAALETEATLKRITRLCHELVQSTRINLLQARLQSRLESLATNDHSSEKMSRIEREYVSTRALKAEHANSGLATVLVYFDTIEQIMSLWNTTMRDLRELDEATRIESHVTREEIIAETAVEREHEAASLERIQLVGQALIAEMIHAIENVFWHLAGCLHHIVTTTEGRHQFLFYVCAAAALVFGASTLKEGISLTCLFILRLFTSPRLVREYGNLKTQPKWFTPRNEKEEIVLPIEVKKRLNMIVQVASAASARGFPMRNILVHGQPGCGKSMVAKTMAQSTGLPYAMMSGGDLSPLKSQGPSELRRLLTWASKGRGGIIIIDEAESALASRSKTKRESNPLKGSLNNDEKASVLLAGYSRDCLNVLLSMTGTFGNIMLILTTSNPSELDEALLDRMDEHVHLHLPSKNERYIILKNAFSKAFCSNQISLGVRTRWSSLFSGDLSKAKYDKSFDVEKTLLDIAHDSNTSEFSGRELKKMIQMILYKTYASDSGILDNVLWKREVTMFCETLASKHLLKK